MMKRFVLNLFPKYLQGPSSPLLGLDFGLNDKHWIMVLEVAMLPRSLIFLHWDVWYPPPSLLNIISSPFIVVLSNLHSALFSHTHAHPFTRAMALLWDLNTLHPAFMYMPLFLQNFEPPPGNELKTFLQNPFELSLGWSLSTVFMHLSFSRPLDLVVCLTLPSIGFNPPV